MPVRPDSRADDRHVFIVVIGRQMEKNPFSHIAFAVEK